MKGNANTHYENNRGVSQRKRRVQRNSSQYSQIIDNVIAFLVCF